MKKIIFLCVSFFYCLPFGYTQAGKPDTSFGNTGIIKTDFGFLLDTFYRPSCEQVLLQSDGAMYVLVGKRLGAFGEPLPNILYFISKRLSNGSPDLNYGNNSFSTPTEIYATQAAQQRDGKIVVAGFIGTYPNKNFALARFNTDGTLDNTFSEDGLQTTNFGSTSEATSVAIQSDGKIVLAGGLGGNFAVFRYNIDGSLDSSFSGDGVQTANFDFGGIYLGTSFASFLSLQNDGKLVAVGGTTQSVGFEIARFNIDGSLDNSFSGDGKETVGFNEYGWASAWRYNMMVKL